MELLNKKQYFLTHSKINFHFSKNSKDFVVEEIPLYELSGSGEHLYILIRKKGLSTPEALQKISEATGCKVKDMGYAGLKDKEGMTVQYISMPKNYESKLENLKFDNLKIINKTYHNNKLKVGHLKGNRFFIRLKKVNSADAAKIEQGLKTISTLGMPNYFGYQRFGKDKNNHILGKELVEGKRRERNKILRKLFINAYQSFMYNEWLAKRIQYSRLVESFDIKELKNMLPFDEEILKYLKNQKQFFKIFRGDVLCHYPYGKLFTAENAEEEGSRFFNKDISVTGLLSGDKTPKATLDALEIEKEYIFETNEFGDRRFAWIFPENITGKYLPEEAWYEIGFYLPKGCYATSLLEELKQGELEFE